MKPFGEFLSNLRTSAGMSLEDLALLAGSSKSTLSRLENDEVPRPFRGAVRKLIITLAEILCASPRESERYLELAGLNRALLAEAEEVQLGFTPPIPVGIPAEEHNLIRLQQIYERRLADLEKRAGPIKRLPANLEIKQQHYNGNLNEIRKELERLQHRKELSGTKAIRVSPAHRITESLVLLNFAHILTESQKARIEELAGSSIDKTLDIPTLINEAEPLGPQIASLLDTIDLSIEEWHTSHILVNPPGYAPAAFLLLAEIHGRSGHFPGFVRLRPVQGSITTYEVAEIINLQAVRDSARISNNASNTSHHAVRV
jgi:transcriptional regulator with XRE-family HTH domain